MGGPAPYNLVAIEDAFDWTSGPKGPQIGTKYTILRRIGLEKQRIFVSYTAPVVSPEMVTQHASAMQFVPMDFVNLNATATVDKSGNLRIYAEAEAVKIVQPAAK